ncbi:MAG TPA: DNA-3-methyladenine glycosylase [Terriglobales bacterium]|nr:DNA-3-methyladenine glycosylase [Terriglobales bacterium]
MNRKAVQASRRSAGVGISGVPASRCQVLPRAFYNRDPRQVSRDLLGKLLIRKTAQRALIGRIVEVEAYLGREDPAAHSFAGRTARNAVLWGPPGHSYVYFIYGNYYCFNVSCLPDGQAGGVLFRALEPVAGLDEMARARGLSGEKARDPRVLTSGPGRLAEAFGITRERDNGKDVTSPESDLIIADDAFRPSRVQTTPRIGITKAPEKLLRYVIAGNGCVSARKAGVPGR